jgi:hypothetical protein
MPCEPKLCDMAKYADFDLAVEAEARADWVWHSFPGVADSHCAGREIRRAGEMQID